MPAPQQGGGGGGPGDGAGAQGVGLPASGSLAPQVDATLRRLLERYRGPEPSDTVEMFEGEKFFAAFERGIDIDAGVAGRPGAGRWACARAPAEPPVPADRPDCVEGRLCFVFYSHLKNLKEVYVTTALDRRARAVRGQVGHAVGAPGCPGQSQSAEAHLLLFPRCPSTGARCRRECLRRQRLPGRRGAQLPCGWPLCPSSCP